jgi:glycosyltransferase involved in cell wall biosynthesis
LNLPADVRIILIGSTNHRDQRKGLRYAIEALQRLPALLPPDEPEVAVLIAGHSDRDYGALLPWRCFPIGHLNNDRLLAMAYQAADVFLCPSLEDVGPLMIPEAILCGTPVVAFAEGCGAPDFVRPGVNGYLAQFKNAGDLAQGIAATLRGLSSGAITPDRCREQLLADWNLEIQGLRYRELYERLHRKYGGSGSSLIS